MHLEHEDNLFLIEGDRSMIPDPLWVYHLYYKTFEESYGKGHGTDMIQKLQSTIESFNEKAGVDCAKLESTDTYFAIAICTPLMRRVHENIPTAGELVCIDSSGGMDRFQCRVFLLMVHTSVGGLPLGIVITSSESENILSIAFELFKSILPESAFYKKGMNGPDIFITDDSSSERLSLRQSFPNSKLILCIFHVLQATWRYIWDAKTAVHKDDRVELFSFVKSLVYSKTVDELSEKYNGALTSPTVQKYPRFHAYFQKLYNRHEEWAICFRDTLPVRNHNTNNLDEAAMRILKDKILLRTKAYNVVQLFDFLVVDSEQYYTRKILHMICGRPDQRLKQGYIGLGKKAQNLKVTPTNSDAVFEVCNIETEQKYIVDICSSNCSCPIGLNGGACKHQFAVVKQQNLSSLQFLPVTKEEKLLFHFIATGDKANVPSNWYADLTAESNSEGSLWPISSHSDVQTPICYELPTAAAIDYSDVILESETALKSFYESVLAKVRQQPDQFCRAVMTGVSNYERCVTDAARVSALTTLGNYGGGGLATKRSRKSYSINVQPTAIARRVKKIGGRKNIITGRPPKSSFTAEHGYNKYKVNSQLMPKRRCLPAPHNLANCVGNNASLGATHSAK